VGRAPLTAHAATHGAAVAVVDAEGDHTYDELLALSGGGAAALLDGRNDFDGARVCLMVTPGWRYVAWQWATWRAGGMRSRCA
jgi:malonyl-CoA/methylmalonyl-CoA synthetase